MSVSEEKPPEGTDAPEPRPGEIVVPRWVVLVTFILGWGLGGATLAEALLTNGSFAQMALGAWLVALPLVAGNPFKALGEILGGITGRK